MKWRVVARNPEHVIAEVDLPPAGDHQTDTDQQNSTMATTDSAPGTPTATPSALPAQRYVPGAPPPVAPTKSQQKKKRQSKLKNLAASAHEAALTDHAPDAEEIKAGKVDPALLASAASGADTDAEDTKSATAAAPVEHEKSLIVDAIAKRVKTLAKKVQRIREYDTANLNEDQKHNIAQLPIFEGELREVESVKKTVEGLEISQAKIRAQERAELAREADRRVAEAAQHAEAALLPRITSLVSFLALRQLLAHATPTDLSISEQERNAILSAGDILLAHPPLGHVEEIVKGFMSGSGAWEDVEYSRLLEITSQFAAPRPPTPIPDPSISLDPTEPTPAPEEPEPEPELEQVEAPAEPETEPEIIANDLGIPAPTTTGGGFHFMQESELDAPPEMTESQEWVAVQPTVNSEDVAVDAEEAQAEIGAQEGHHESEVAGGVTGGGAPLDWANAGEDELPDIGGLQATFGGSGSQTPVAQPPAAQTAATSSAPAVDDDGFTAIPNRRGHGNRGSFGGERGFRGRGRGRGGFRGGEGGGYRNREGGEGGGYRQREGGEGGEGGEAGGYRGRGGYRGGYRGGDGGEGGEGEGYRGRGGYRGGGEGGRGRGFGGGWAQGEGRGRGRGEYRGGGERRGSGFRGGRGGTPGGASTPTAETAA
ncbi:hypothetical protein RhiJN_24290 [Ceratobasidium sp. AG-Ba]|nr:hypothetical protein RhiJN_24290 [Ceratobasidium sp. AG-Ba]